jgi:hypothetical protein
MHRQWAARVNTLTCRIWRAILPMSGRTVMAPQDPTDGYNCLGRLRLR